MTEQNNNETQELTFMPGYKFVDLSDNEDYYENIVSTDIFDRKNLKTFEDVKENEITIYNLEEYDFTRFDTDYSYVFKSHPLYINMMKSNYVDRLDRDSLKKLFKKGTGNSDVKQFILSILLSSNDFTFNIEDSFPEDGNLENTLYFRMINHFIIKESVDVSDIYDFITTPSDMTKTLCNILHGYFNRDMENIFKSEDYSIFNGVNFLKVEDENGILVDPDSLKHKEEENINLNVRLSKNIVTSLEEFKLYLTRNHCSAIVDSKLEDILVSFNQTPESLKYENNLPLDWRNYLSIKVKKLEKEINKIAYEKGNTQNIKEFCNLLNESKSSNFNGSDFELYKENISDLKFISENAKLLKIKNSRNILNDPLFNLFIKETISEDLDSKIMSQVTNFSLVVVILKSAYSLEVLTFIRNYLKKNQINLNIPHFIENNKRRFIDLFFEENLNYLKYYGFPEDIKNIYSMFEKHDKCYLLRLLSTGDLNCLRHLNSYSINTDNCKTKFSMDEFDLISLKNARLTINYETKQVLELSGRSKFFKEFCSINKDFAPEKSDFFNFIFYCCFTKNNFYKRYKEEIFQDKDILSTIKNFCQYKYSDYIEWINDIDESETLNVDDIIKGLRKYITEEDEIENIDISNLPKELSDIKESISLLYTFYRNYFL
jgi:hypothetical protein